MAKISRFEDMAIDLNYISRDEFERPYSKSVETLKLIRGFIKYLTPDSRLLTKD